VLVAAAAAAAVSASAAAPGAAAAAAAAAAATAAAAVLHPEEVHTRDSSLALLPLGWALTAEGVCRTVRLPFPLRVL